ncbi:MAG: hypothetical protein FWE90_03205 [Defluviitaleaceae bacterium]|nr:hypothetical protein [Defluviitaleaceae bacterium]
MPFRKLIIPILVGLFNITLLAFPREALGAAREGLLLWFHTVLPSLLPFAVGMNILIKLGFMRFFGECITPLTKKVFGVGGAGGVAFITGVTSGYPIGAKVIGDLYREGDVKADEAQRLMAFCNNAGPLFIVGAVGLGMFGDAKAGYILWAGHILGALAIGLLGRFMRGTVKEKDNRRTRKDAGHLRTEPFGKVLGESVGNAMEAMVLVGGLIIFFNVFFCILHTIFKPDDMIIGGLINGLLEVSGGARMISAHGPDAISLSAAAFVIAFGGLSVHAQAMHFTVGTGVKAGIYLSHKLLHGILAAVFTTFLWLLT